MAMVGIGKHTYELVEDWTKLPKGWTLGQTGIVTDARDRVYLFNRSEHPLIVLDRDGVFIASWGEGILTSASLANLPTETLAQLASELPESGFLRCQPNVQMKPQARAISPIRAENPRRRDSAAERSEFELSVPII
jgi:hypothetical protein